MSAHATHEGVLALTDDTFAVVVEEEKGVALIDFGADWCPPCRMMKPVIARIAARYAGRAIVATVDVDANPRIADKYDARSLPTFLFFVDGEPVSGIVGAVPEAKLTERLDALLAAYEGTAPAA